MKLFQILSKKKIVAVSILAIFSIIFSKIFFIPLGLDGVGKKKFMVRVRIVHDADMIEVASKNGCILKDSKTDKLLSRRLDLRSGIKIYPDIEGVKFGEKIFKFDNICISSNKRNFISVNGLEYRGEVHISKTDSGFDVVNKVELENYLKGVLPEEIQYYWPFAVIKAQAIASRSFVVHQAMRRKNKDYDVTADTFSQVYSGRSSERWRTSKAVEATRGEILWCNGKILAGYFHSCCGGHTQDASRVWKGDSVLTKAGRVIESLKGVKCLWCRWSPHFRWRCRVPTKDVMIALNDKGYLLKDIKNIKEGTRDSSRRLEYVRVRSQNKWFEIEIEEFRSIVGRRFLKSSNFRIKRYPHFYLFSGYGWGHGVGMCQWGAFGLAIRRWTTENILRRYYPGSEVVDM